MNALLLALASILGITGAMWLLRSRLRVPLCPICLGVGGTWLWMLVARYLGFAVDTVLLAVLLGGSAAAIAEQVEKRLPPQRSALLWKALFLPPAFAGAYAAATTHWLWLGAAVIGLSALTILFLRRPLGAEVQGNETVDELTRKMKNCC